MKESLIRNDAVVFGVLFCTLYGVFATAQSRHPFWVRFYKFVPALLLCYFIPALYNSFGLIDGEKSQLYSVASRYLLPASLVLLTLSMDLKSLLRLGPKALIMFFTGTLGVVLGGPLALWICLKCAPSIVAAAGANDLWRGLSTVAGSWIGGGANQAAMKEIFQVDDALFSSMITVDVLIADTWMAFLLLGIGVHHIIDRYLKADSSSLAALTEKLEDFQKENERITSSLDIYTLGAIAFGLTALGHFLADFVAPYFQNNFPDLAKYGIASQFFWVIALSTIFAIGLSFSKLRHYEGAGASKLGGVFIMLLVATIGMRMNVFAIFDNLGLFFIGFLWISFHIILLFLVAKLIRAPFFFLAVGSQANIGGAASAPIIASAFSPALAPVGVLLAILGYAIGTYAAWVSSLLMQWVVS